MLIIAFTTWYTVDESEQAVVITFGKADTTVTDSGLHFKLPWPIQRAEILSKETFSLQFGYKQDPGGELVSFDKETKMITGDEYIVLTDLVVQWKITEPQKYLFNAQNPKKFFMMQLQHQSVLLLAVRQLTLHLRMGRQKLKHRQEIYLATLN